MNYTYPQRIKFLMVDGKIFSTSVIFVQLSKVIEYLRYCNAGELSNYTPQQHVADYFLSSIDDNDLLTFNEIFTKQLEKMKEYTIPPMEQQDVRHFTLQELKDMLDMFLSEWQSFKKDKEECKKLLKENGIVSSSNENVSTGIQDLLKEHKILREAIASQEAETKKLYKKLEENEEKLKKESDNTNVVNGLKFKVKSLSEELTKALNTIADLKYDLSLVKTDKEGVWFWQNDGWDDPESLSCPVVMSAETLRNLLKNEI